MSEGPRPAPPWLGKTPPLRRTPTSARPIERGAPGLGAKQPLDVPSATTRRRKARLHFSCIDTKALNAPNSAALPVDLRFRRSSHEGTETRTARLDRPVKEAIHLFSPKIGDALSRHLAGSATSRERCTGWNQRFKSLFRRRTCDGQLRAPLVRVVTSPTSRGSRGKVVIERAGDGPAIWTRPC